MKKTLSLIALILIFSHTAFATSSPLVGKWASSCIPTPQGSMKLRSVVEASGIEANFVSIYGTADCTGESMDTDATVQTYTLEVKKHSFIMTTVAVVPSTVAEGQPYWFKGECRMISANKMKMKYFGAILNVNGAPVPAPQAVLDQMSSLVWSRL